MRVHAHRQWQFQPTSNGYVRVNAPNNAAQALDVTNVSTADSAPIQLWSYSNGLNQQWLPVEEGDGAYHFVNRNSGKCLDVPGASTADSVQLQQYSCNGTAAQSFTISGSTGWIWRVRDGKVVYGRVYDSAADAIAALEEESG